MLSHMLTQIYFLARVAQQCELFSNSPMICCTYLVQCRPLIAGLSATLVRVRSLSYRLSAQTFLL